MPHRIKQMHPDSLIAEYPGVKAYAKDIRDQYPLYRGVKLMADGPTLAGRRTAHLTWVVHLARFRSGGDGWRLLQQSPEIITWLAAECAKQFDANYVGYTFGLDGAEYEALVAAEEAKYA